jgi:Outer membrane protein transport protein (OMPP1/FadL/TodX)
LTYRLSDRVLLGAVYRAEMEVDLEGDVKFQNLGALTPPIKRVDISWDNPQTLEAGLSYRLIDGNTLFFNAGWQDWSAFSNNDLDFTGAGVVSLDRNWKDTWEAGTALSNIENREGYSVGFSYESRRSMMMTGLLIYRLMNCTDFPHHTPGPVYGDWITRWADHWRYSAIQKSTIQFKEFGLKVISIATTFCF